MNDAILFQLADTLLNEVVNNDFNIITFSNLVTVLEKKHQVTFPPEELDYYLEELSLICFALELPLLSAMVVGKSYQPSPRFYNLYRELYKDTTLDVEAIHRLEVERITKTYDWTKLSKRLRRATSPKNEAPQKEHIKQITPMTEAEFQKEFERKVKESLAMDASKRSERINNRSSVLPEPRILIKHAYELSPDVVAEVLERSNGNCERCLKSFPRLKIFHQVPLEEGGEDTVSNTQAICPNCEYELIDK